jgi:diketogulonate reductase-like aldo/keto reductase
MLPVSTVRTTELPSGEPVPVLGQGTWGLGESVHPRKQEIEALRVGIDLGMTLIDTAEMYASGEAEKVVGKPSRVAAEKSSLPARCCRNMRASAH